MRPLQTAVALGLMVLAGCGAGMEAEVGTGSFDFQALPANGAVQIVCGAQGFQHIWVSIRSHGVGPDNVNLTLAIVDPANGNAHVCGEQLDGLPLDSANGWDQFTGVACVIPDPTAVDGKTLRLVGDLVDAAGHHAHDEHVIVPSGPGKDCHH